MVQNSRTDRERQSLSTTGQKSCQFIRVKERMLTASIQSDSHLALPSFFLTRAVHSVNI